MSDASVLDLLQAVAVLAGWFVALLLVRAACRWWLAWREARAAVERALLDAAAIVAAERAARAARAERTAALVSQAPLKFTTRWSVLQAAPWN